VKTGGCDAQYPMAMFSNGRPFEVISSEVKGKKLDITSLDHPSLTPLGLCKSFLLSIVSPDDSKYLFIVDDKSQTGLLRKTFFVNILVLT
jgi:hypothetical protein